MLCTKVQVGSFVEGFCEPLVLHLPCAICTCMDLRVQGFGGFEGLGFRGSGWV